MRRLAAANRYILRQLPLLLSTHVGPEFERRFLQGPSLSSEPELSSMMMNDDVVVVVRAPASAGHGPCR